MIGNQAQTLLSSAGELPAEAKSLGFKGAPKALKAIKAASGILKNIPNEVTSVGGEAKNVMEEIDQVLKNIQVYLELHESNLKKTIISLYYFFINANPFNGFTLGYIEVLDSSYK